MIGGMGNNTSALAGIAPWGCIYFASPELSGVLIRQVGSVSGSPKKIFFWGVTSPKTLIYQKNYYTTLKKVYIIIATLSSIKKVLILKEKNSLDFNPESGLFVYGGTRTSLRRWSRGGVAVGPGPAASQGLPRNKNILHYYDVDVNRSSVFKL